jgi:hypothetical protein
VESLCWGIVAIIIITFFCERVNGRRLVVKTRDHTCDASLLIIIIFAEGAAFTVTATTASATATTVANSFDVSFGIIAAFRPVAAEAQRHVIVDSPDGVEDLLRMLTAGTPLFSCCNLQLFRHDLFRFPTVPTTTTSVPSRQEIRGADQAGHLRPLQQGADDPHELCAPRHRAWLGWLPCGGERVSQMTHQGKQVSH